MYRGILCIRLLLRHVSLHALLGVVIPDVWHRICITYVQTLQVCLEGRGDPLTQGPMCFEIGSASFRRTENY